MDQAKYNEYIRFDSGGPPRNDNRNSPLDILWKGILGGLVTAAIAWAAKRGNVLPGVLPLFPIFTIFSLLAIGAKGSVEGFHETATAAAKTIPVYLSFLGTAYFLTDKMDYRLAVFLGLCAWFVAVWLMFQAPKLLG